MDRRGAERIGARGCRCEVGSISSMRWPRRDRAAVDRSRVSGRPES